MNKSSRLLIVTILGAATLNGIAQTPVKAPARRPHDHHTQPPFTGSNPQRPQFGDPLPGLAPDQLAAFFDGKDDFTQVEDVEGGLGPIFNRDSCVACHSQAGVGGGSNITVTRFGRMLNGVFDPLTELGGSLLQENSILGHGQEVVPPEANVVAHRQSTPLFGLGLIEAIPDAAILRGIKPPNPDGIKGKASQVQDVASGQLRIGRFGWKAQQATLLSFAGDAYLNEMGITSRFFPTENAPNGDAALLAQLDTVADIEDIVDPQTGKADIDRAADFMRLLAPPPRLPLTQSGLIGRDLFNQINCASCHTPQMFTGPDKVRSLSMQPVYLFSDLLLHDMGSLGDGIAQGTAGTTEMKTAPLWGLRASGPYLHDGRAATVADAIKAHDGEGKASRDRFLKLTPQQQGRLIEFLMSN